MIAPRSSRIANAVRKIFNSRGTRLPSIARMPSENAMSVAAGIANPRSTAASPRVTHKNVAQGRTMPPTAASAGKAARSKVRRSPSSTSRLISMPTNTKNTAIRPSLIQSNNGFESSRAPMRTTTGVSRNAS
jgi:hypothetical protein